jgi:GT2 family glycosyltransferase
MIPSGGDGPVPLSSETSEPCVDVLMAVHNGASWLPGVLAALSTQASVRVRLLVWDNASTDGTPDLVIELFPTAEVIRSEENLGFWAAIERLSEKCRSELFLALTDVHVSPDFLASVIPAFDDAAVGAVQGKLYELRNGTRTRVIDTVGFRMDRGRHITIAGHGETDRGQYAHAHPIFAVEGAAPVFRTRAFREAAIEGHVVDPDFRVGPLGYEDLDIAWRLALFGWRQVFAPAAVGWHDRSTTHTGASGPVSRLRRVPQRRSIPLEKRILGWTNMRFAIVKNDRTSDLLRDLPWILAHEILVLGYMLAFEPGALTGLKRFARLLPSMLRRRRAVQARARADLRAWID